MIVRLKTQYTDQNGGVAFRGERVAVPDDVAAKMIARGVAERIQRDPPRDPQPHRIERVTKPSLPEPDLKGAAKREWLRRQIEARGGTPEGRTIGALQCELAAL